MVMMYEHCASGEDLTCKTVDVWYSVSRFTVFTYVREVYETHEK